MTVAAGKTPYHSYSPGAAMAAEAIPFDFGSLDDLHVEVVGGAALAYGTDYSVSGDHAGGTASITAMLDAGADVWHLWSVTAREQALDLAETRVLPLGQYENELDRRARIEREIDHDVSRTVRVERGQDGLEIPSSGGLAVVARGEDGVVQMLAVTQVEVGEAVAIVGGLASTLAWAAVAADVTRVDTIGYAAAGKGAGTYISDTLADAALKAAHPRFCFGPALGGQYFRLIPEGEKVTFDQGGAVGDGATDDGPAAYAAVKYAEAFGYKWGACRRTYALAVLPDSVHNWPGAQPNLVFQPESWSIDLGGATLLLANGSGGIRAGAHYALPFFDDAYGEDSTRSEIVEDLAVGETAIDLAAGEGANWAVDQRGFLKGGEQAIDEPEGHDPVFFRIKAVAGDTVTIDTPNRREMLLAGMTGYGEFMHNWAPFERVHIHDGHLEAAAGNQAEAAFRLHSIYNFHMERVTARRSGLGVVSLAYCQHALIEACAAEEITTFAVASYGRGYGFQECPDATMIACSARNLRTMILAEASSNVTAIKPEFENTVLDPGTGLPRTDVIAFHATGHSTITTYGALITGYGGFVLDSENQHTGADYRAFIRHHDLRMRLSSEIKSLNPRALRGTFTYQVGDAERAYDFNRLRRWTRKIRLKPGMNLEPRGPRGITVELRVRLSAGMAGKFGAGLALTRLYFGRVGDNGSDIVQQAVAGHCYGPLVAGEEVSVTVLSATGLENWDLRDEQIKFLIQTAAEPAFDAEGESITLTWIGAEPLDHLGSESDNLGAWTDSDWEADELNGGEDDFEFEATYDWPDLATATEQTTTVTVPGVALGDFVDRVGMSVALGGSWLRGEVTAADTVTITQRNDTGGNVNVASGLITGRVVKRKLGV